MPERRHRLAIAIPVRPVGVLRVGVGVLPVRELLRERVEAERARAVARREGVERLAVREDRLEVVAARGRVRAGTDLVEDGLQVRAAADGWRWGRCGRGGAGV